MDVKIQINGTFLEGVTNTDIKLSINASSPYAFGESTRTYSATIKAPRNRTNDAVFIEMRNLGLTRRKTKYEAKIYLGGIAINKRFKAKVSCNADNYDVAISQVDLKLSQLPKEIIYASLTSSGEASSLFATAKELLFRNMGYQVQFNFPTIEGGYEPGILVEYLGQVALTDALVGKNMTVFWRYPSESDEGTKYFKGNDLDVKEYETRMLITAPGGVTTNTTAVVTLDNNGYIILDMSEVGTILNYVVLKAVYNNQTVAIFQKDDNQTDITQVRYKYVSTTMNVPIYIFNGFYISRDINVYDRLSASPPRFMSPDEAVNLQGKITAIQNSAGLTQTWGDIGVTSAVDFLTDICKAFQFGWRYSISEDNSATPGGTVTYQVSAYKILNDAVFNLLNGPIPVGDNAYIQNWTDYYVSTEKIEDADGFPSNGVFQIGEYTKSLQLSDAAFNTKGEVFSVGFPYPTTNTYPRTCLRRISGSITTLWKNYFQSQEYTDRLTKYYRRFSDALDVTIKAKIPYYAIENEYKEDGVVWFKQLNAFFYVRSITDYSMSTGDCKIKLTKINLLR